MDVRSIKESVLDRGYAFLTEYRPDADTAAIARSLGDTLSPHSGQTVQELVPRPTAAPNTYSGIYGLNLFPFHTDLAHWRTPPRYLLLRCLTGYADVPTHMIDGMTLIHSVTPNVLSRALVKPRRPIKGEIRLLRLCDPTDHGYFFRWDEVFLTPASRVGEVAMNQVKEQISSCLPLSIALKRPGDLLLIDNRRMLHARSPVHAKYGDRKIQRVYLENLH